MLEANVPIAVVEIDPLYRLFEMTQYTGLPVESIYQIIYCSTTLLMMSSNNIENTVNTIIYYIRGHTDVYNIY